MVTTMIKRVARALSDSDEMYMHPQDWHFAYARAAIAAMREPTAEMLDAYWEQTGESEAMRSRTHAYMRRYQSAMIDAALEEKL